MEQRFRCGQCCLDRIRRIITRHVSVFAEPRLSSSIRSEWHLPLSSQHGHVYAGYKRAETNFTARSSPSLPHYYILVHMADRDCKPAQSSPAGTSSSIILISVTFISVVSSPRSVSETKRAVT